MEGEKEKLKRYLLGVLSDQENEAIDLRVISDETFEEELSLAEDDLIEDFLEETLSPDEKNLFYLNFLTSPLRRARLREIGVLKEFSKKEFRDLKKGEPSESATKRYGGLFGFGLRPLVALGGVLVLLVSFLLVWNNYYRQTVSPLETKFAELNKQDLSDLKTASVYYAINLSSGTFRDSAATAKYRADELTDIVLFRLAMQGDTPINSAFKTKIIRNGEAVLMLDGVRSYRNPAGTEIRLLVPGPVLKQGQYQISVESDDRPGIIGTYVFTID